MLFLLNIFKRLSILYVSLILLSCECLIYIILFLFDDCNLFEKLYVL